MVANTHYISPEEYLAMERDSPVKHEYRAGQVYAMAGASNAHVLIALNLATALRNDLRGSGCLPYVSDTKVHIQAIDRYYYPDVIVNCDQRDRAFDNFLRYPCFIAEVLSDTTEAFDRGDKFADYRQLETLEEYVLISQKRVSIDVFRRSSGGVWVLQPYTKGAEIELKSINFCCPIQLLYEDIIFGQPTAT